MKRMNIIISTSFILLLIVALLLWHLTHPIFSPQKINLIRSNLTVGAAMYVDENDGKMPPNVDALIPYLGNPKLMDEIHSLQKVGYRIKFNPAQGNFNVPGMVQAMQGSKDAKVGVQVDIVSPTSD